MNSFTVELLSWASLIPAAVLCLTPMRNQLKYGVRRTAADVALSFLVLLPLMAYLSSRPGAPEVALQFLFLGTMFLLYQSHLRTPVWKSIAVFAHSCALTSFMGNYGTVFDALLRPDAPPDTYSAAGALIQLGLMVISCAGMGYLYHRFGCRLVDEFHMRGAWDATTAVSLIFAAFNLMLYVHDYRTFYTTRVLEYYCMGLGLMLVLMVLLTVLLYFIVKGLQAQARDEERRRFLEMQESQYQLQQKYMEETAARRHDFRQSIRTLQELSREKDYEALDRYLDEYARALPQSDVTRYCRNTALNALLNYYAHSLAQEKIPLQLEVELPDAMGVSDVDICTMAGNVLENAQNACLAVPEEERRIELHIVTRGLPQLMIVCVNSFDGHVRMHGDRYLSTQRRGSGLGLESIIATAERCGGAAQFRHEGKEFFSEIMVPLWKD